MGEVFYWIFTFLLILALLCVLGYQVILPEFIMQGIFCITNLLAGHWIIFLIGLPCMYYNVTLYIKKEHLADVTEIYNKLNWEKKKRLFKVGHSILLFVLAVLSLVWSLSEE
ncbi:hypothetical protein PIB30_064174 [Stylosanthes scabra]|uniref:Uncharacterized protein n=1 Tax=Stylosanthes scabra TaxID=79078 RepID=A0ABU6YL21_9FABA|nr:hypothetical protein [Stylosanthes scabra]